MISSSFRPGLVALCGLCFVAGLSAQTPPAAPKLDFPEASPPASVTQRIGLTDIQVSYARPGAKGRKVTLVLAHSTETAPAAAVPALGPAVTLREGHD